LGVQKKSANIQNGDCSLPTHVGEFESCDGHVYNPNDPPARLQSAAERARKKIKTVPLDIVLELGMCEDMEKSGFQKAQDARKKPRSLKERGETWAERLDKNSKENQGASEPH
jgi:hypothetical protein